MKESSRIQLGLENLKQATIHLAFVLQLKGDGGIPQGAKSSSSSRGFRVALPQISCRHLPLYKDRPKDISVFCVSIFNASNNPIKLG